MKVNFYFQSPSPDPEWAYAHNVAAKQLLERFKKKYKDIQFNHIEYVTKEYLKNEDLYRYDKFLNNTVPSHFVIIENEETKKYFLLGYWDHYYGETVNWDLENCVGEFPAYGIQMNHSNYQPMDRIYTPTSPTNFIQVCETYVDEFYKINEPKITPDKPYFRSGRPYLFREYIHTNDNRFTSYDEWISKRDFIKELSQNSVMVDINSVAEWSSRSVEAFGLKVAVVRPEFRIQWHNPLIPNYHYAKLDCDDIGDYKLLADAYIHKFEEVKKDKELIHFLTTNARKWYEENCTIEKHVDILESLIDINKLA